MSVNLRRKILFKSYPVVMANLPTFNADKFAESIVLQVTSRLPDVSLHNFVNCRDFIEEELRPLITDVDATTHVGQLHIDAEIELEVGRKNPRAMRGDAARNLEVANIDLIEAAAVALNPESESDSGGSDEDLDESRLSPVQRRRFAIALAEDIRLYFPLMESVLARKKRAKQLCIYLGISTRKMIDRVIRGNLKRPAGPIYISLENSATQER